MFLSVPIAEMDESRRKRQIHEVADAEDSPNPSRLRVSPKQRVVDGAGAPSDHGEDRHQYSSGSDSDFTSAEDEDANHEYTRDSSFEHNGDDTVEHSPTAAEHGNHGQYASLRVIPQSWEEASEADRILVKMKSKGLSWDEIGKAWKGETGEDTAHIVLLNRYNRLKDNVHTLKDGDSERLLAAVDEVKAVFEREKWQLVKNAMNRAGAAEYPKGFIRKQYKNLVRASIKTNATRSAHAREIETSGGIVPMQESRIASDAAVAEPAPVKSGSTPLGLPPIGTVNKSADSSPNRTKVSAGAHSATMSTVRSSMESEAVKTEGEVKGAPEVPNPEGIKTVDGRGVTMPGSLATNAIVVDDTDTASSPALKVIDPVAPVSQAVAKPAAPGPRPAPSLGITSSRVGSATNRGPARFTSLHKARDDDAITRQRNPLNPSPGPTRIEPAKSPITASLGGFGMLVNQGALKYTPHNVPSNIQQRMAMQQNGLVEKGPSQKQPHHQQPSLVTPAQPQPVSAQARANIQPPTINTPVSHGQHVESASNKPLPYQKPPELQTPLQPESTQQHPPIQSIELEPQSKALTPTQTIDAVAVDEGLLGKPKQPVNIDQLKYMLRYKTLNDANRSKTWDIIARECGVTVTVAEISVALEQEGYSSILNTSEPLGPANPATPISPEGLQTHVSSYAPSALSQTPPVTGPAATPAVSTANARAFETPAPATTPGLDGTPNTRSRRGRPPGSKNKPKDQVRGEQSSMSPSHTKTPVSGQKGHIKGAETRAAQSAAMKAAWKRRKERAASGQQGVSQNPTAAAGNNLVGASAATFAAEILAAAAANKNAAPIPAPQATGASAPSARPQPLDDEPVDLLTGESMFAQHYDDLPPAKKIVRRSIASRPI